MKLHRSGFTLVEGLISTGLVLLLISGIWFMWISGSRNSGSGQAMQEKFHRLRIVTEVLKDDLREGVTILTPAGHGDSSPVLKFQKYAGITDDEPQPKLKDVEYIFDPKTHELVGSYGTAKEVVVRTNLFEDVSFQRMEAMGRVFIRMTFTILPDDDPNKRPLKIVHTVCPRRLGTLAAKSGWYSLKETRPVPESP